MNKRIAFLSLILAVSLPPTANAYEVQGREHYGFGVEFLSCMAKAKIFLATPVCVFVAGIDAIVNPPEKYRPESSLETGPSIHPVKTYASLPDVTITAPTAGIMPDVATTTETPVTVDGMNRPAAK